MKKDHIKHQLEYCMYSNKVSWCPICKSHFYNERNKIHIEGKQNRYNLHELERINKKI